jgi:hypothetical protein
MVRTAAIRLVSAVAGHDWLVWRARAIVHNDTMPRGYRLAELYEHNLDPTSTPPLNKYIHIDPVTTIH